MRKEHWIILIGIAAALIAGATKNIFFQEEILPGDGVRIENGAKKEPVTASPDAVKKLPYKEIKLSEIFSLGGGHSYSSEILDFDRDGSPDMAIGNYDQQSYVYINNDDRTFEKSPVLRKARTKAIVSADLNNDGWDDLAVGNYNEKSAVYLNNKDYSFEYLPVLGTGATEALLAADLDNDGKIDIFRGTREQGIYVYRNIDGRDFEEKRIVSEKMQIRSLTACRLNGEMTDIIVGIDFSRNYILKNEGDLKFTLIPAFGEKQHTTSIACADFNKDGKMDVAVVGKSQKPTDLTRNYLYVNLGNYQFDQILEFGEAYTSVVLADDFNRDGLMDVFVGNYEADSFIFENMGDLKFRKLPAIGKSYIHSASSADFDRDGYPDIVITKDVMDSKVYVNG